MPEKQLYVSLLKFKPEFPASEPLKFITAVVATTAAEARNLAIEDVIREHGGNLRDWQPEECGGYWLTRSKLEQAAREVLGWNPPSES